MDTIANDRTNDGATADVTLSAPIQMALKSKSDNVQN